MRYAKYVLPLLLILLMGLAAVSNDSLWMDEGKRLYHAQEGTWKVLSDGMGQDMQPLFFLQEWAWGNALCFKDWVMRGMNVPFLLLAAGYFMLILRQLKLHPAFALLLGLHPMAAYYVNDISPYIILLACTFGVLYHGFFARSSWGNLAGMHVWLVLAYAYHFVAGFMLFIYAFAVAAGLWRQKKDFPLLRHAAVALLFCVVYLPLTWYYLQHMHDGTGHGMGAPGAGNLSYVLYSLLGFQGLGLSRNDIRAAHWGNLTPAMVASLVVYLLCLAAVALLNLRALGQLLRQRFVLCLAGYAAVFMAAAFVMKFQFWERHLMPLLAAVLVLEAQLLRAAWQGGRLRIVGRAAVAGVLACQLLSCAQLRLNPYHGKEDFKGVLEQMERNGSRTDGSLTIMQGHLAVWECYKAPWTTVGVYLHNPLAVKEGTMLSIDSLTTPQVLECVDYLMRRHRKMYLILCEKADSTRDLYPAAAETLQRRGYKVECDSSHNSFKILTLTQDFLF